MSDNDDRDRKLAELRAPFPPGTVGKLPKPYKRDSPKGQCNVCHGYHGLPAAHLDYVGHAAVTDRLLSVDPAWTWEFAETNPDTGKPSLRHSIDPDGNLWIRLTACGVTRIGVGDGKDMKERIGDALRNAAMRFGVALDLWSKEELESGLVAEQGHQKTRPDTPPENLYIDLLAEKKRVFAHARGDDDDAKKQWIAAAFTARGTDPNNPADVKALADELEAA